MSSHDFNTESLRISKKLHGNIELKTKMPIKNEHDLSVFYTPGVGAVSSFLAKYPEQASEYTIKNNTVAVISDGSAVLGLGNIGPLGALPVMEGKSALFKELGGVDAFPVCLNTQDVDEIVLTIKNIAPVFAGINLEDIAAPRCFEIERRLQEELDIPVVHDDQHATAIVTLAGLINSLKVVGKNARASKVVILGCGAAGNATAQLLTVFGFADVIVLDSKGIINKSRTDLDINKQKLCKITNQQAISGGIVEATKGADILICLTSGGKISKDVIANMNTQPIVFALSNPDPEILPDHATRAGAVIVATGRSDYPNQINNVLVFPGLFKGLIESKQKKLTSEIKIKAAKALAGCIKKPNANKIIPTVFDKNVVPTVARAVSSK